MLGTQDLLLGAVIAFFLFGAKRLPELMGSIGKSMREFKKGIEESTAPEDGSRTAKAVPAVVPDARTCGSCQAPLEADWQHCPRCGSPAPPLASRPSAQ